jgi:replicative DNA helicase
LLVGGDDVKDLARVLRVPGTSNHKYDPPRPVVFVRCDLERRYARAELAQLCDAFMPSDALPDAGATGTVNMADLGSRWLGSAVARVRSAGDGTKHHVLLRAARALGGLVAHGALTEHEIENSLFAAIETRADDPENARKTIADGIAYGKASPWAASALERGYDAAERSSDGHSANSANSAKQEVWGAVIRFDAPDLPPFPTDIFPDWLRAFVDAEAEATQTPPDLSGMLALSVLATCCQRWMMVQARPGWFEPVNLYTVTALPPASRKSAVFRAFVSPLLAYEQQQAIDAKKRIAELEARKDITEQQLDAAKRTAARAASQDEKLDAMEEVDRLSSELAYMTIAPAPRLVVDDVTPEALASLISDQGGRMAALSPEGDVFAIMAGRYTSGGPNFSVFLKAHAGDTLRVDRKTRSEFVDWPALTLGITTQPDVVRGLAEKAGFRGQGLLGRFLYALPESLVGHRKTDAPPVPEAVRRTYHAAIGELLTWRAAHSANCANTANVANESLIDSFTSIVFNITISGQGDALFTAFLEWLEPHLATDGAFGSIADWAGKLAGAVIRVAGLLHIAEHIGSHNSHNSPEPISPETMAAALRLSDYLIAHARAAFAEMGADPAIAAARRALRWLEVKGCTAFTKRDMFEALKGTLPKADDLDPILKILTDHAYIRPIEGDERGGPGRKPSQRYEVNPHIGSHNSHNSRNGLPAFEIPAFSSSHNSHNSPNGLKEPEPVSAAGLLATLYTKQGRAADAARILEGGHE